MTERTPRIVVFDLGGVLARICHTWDEAARGAGIDYEGGDAGLASLPAFDRYQSGAIGLPEYLASLGTLVGCDGGAALRIHNGIIVEEYPGIATLVDDLISAGLETGCLSNTNAPHWEHLALNGAFPSIHRLTHKMASHLVGLNKPDPRIFRLYAEKFKFEPGEIIYFDDHPANVRAALDEGWRAFPIDPEGDTAQQLRRHLAAAGIMAP